MGADLLDPTSLGASAGSLTRLRTAAQAVDSGLLVVTCPDTGLGHSAAAAVALADATSVWSYREGADAPSGVHPDVHLAQPAGPSWTVAEVEDRILRPARLTPVHRGHVVVADAHRMAGIAADRVLKAVEEPRGDVLFWFVAPAESALGATLRGRAARVLSVEPLPLEQRLPALVLAGADEPTAKEIAELAGDRTRLAITVARHGLLEPLRTYTTTPGRMLTAQSPVLAAGAGFAAAALLAHGLVSVNRLRVTRPQEDPQAAWDKLASPARAEVRALVRELVAGVREQVTDGLLEAHGDRDLAVGDGRLRACAAALSELDVGANPLTVLSALAVRCRLAAAGAPGRP